MTDLDRELDRHLQRLPAPQAPATLLPRVLAAVGQLDRSPWYARPWIAWPRGLQVVSATVVVLVIAAFVTDAPVLQWISPSLASSFSGALDPLQSFGHFVSQASTLARVFWHVWLEPIAAYLAVLFVLVSLAVSAALSLVNQLTPEQA
jgi:hypothetical protein